MVGIENQKPIPVRFLINKAIKKGSSLYAPWRLYILPKFVLDIMELPYEELEPSPLHVGTRIAKLANVMDFNIGSGCCGCTELQKLLDATTPEWIQLHLNEIVEQIRCNAKKKINFRPPKKMVEGAVRLAIVLERRALKFKYKRAMGKET